jgi:hypothetical protein
MIAKHGAPVASMPSMQADASPRRPICLRQRTFGRSCVARRMISGVPSLESSSTKMTS